MWHLKITNVVAIVTGYETYDLLDIHVFDREIKYTRLRKLTSDMRIIYVIYTKIKIIQNI